MTDRIVEPCACLKGEIRAPGDKSVSHRAGMLAALADGRSTIHNFLEAEDCMNTLAAVAALGARVDIGGGTVYVEGTDGRFSPPPCALDMGNSGTGMRLLSGLLAGQEFPSELTGDTSLLSRPMGRVHAPLHRMGATVDLLGGSACGPIRIVGGGLRGIEYELPVASAQVKSCILLAGLFAEGTTTVVEPRKTRDHTERAFAFLGVPMECDGSRISVNGVLGRDYALPAKDWRVPGDFSSAAFWLAAACRPGSDIVVTDIGLNPRRTALLAVLRRMGADIAVEEQSQANAEPAGKIHVRGCQLTATTVEGDEIPNLIDEIPIIAVVAALAEGETVIRDAHELRVKESDRIATTVAALEGLGVDVLEKPDGMHIQGGGRVRGGGVVKSAGDHRIAMAFSILALAADKAVTIEDVDCVATSYPDFWGHLEQLRRVQ